MKITKYFLATAAALGMIAGCQKPELVQLVAPEDAKAPVLEAVEDVVFTDENLAIGSYDFNWSPLDYGAKLEIDYTLEAYIADGEPLELAAKLNKPVFEISYENLNGILNYKLGLEAGKSTDVYFRVTGKFNDYEPVSSEVAKAKFTVVDAVAPILKPFEGGKIEIDVDNISTDKATFSWDAAKYGKNTPIDYSIVLSLPGSEKKVSVAGKLNDAKTSAEVAYKDINGVVLYDLEVPANEETEVEFYVEAKIGDFATILSEEPVIVPVKVTEAEKQYPKLTVAGSYAYNGWTPGKGQFVFDFEGTDAKYSGVIDFGEDVSALQFKFVGSKWGENEFSVPAGETQAPEAAELTLVAGGGDNIAAYTTHRFYSLTLDKATPKLIKNFSFNQIGVIGSFNEWGGDVVMNFNADKQRFYADVEFAEDGQFKLRADADWALNWGADAFGMTVSNGDGNLEAKAGSYRIYANMNNPAAMTIELNAGMYGKEEPVGDTTPEEPKPEEPVTLVGWGLVGAFSGWADGADVMLASDGTFLVAKGVALEGEFKFRKDGAWGTNFGAAEGAAFAANTEVALAQDGANLVAEAGTYDVYLDEVNGKAWFITDGSYPGGGAAPEASEWGIVGQVNGWAAPDITMYKTATEGLFVAYKVEMPDGGFKIRANGEWNDAANYGLAAAGPVEVDHVYDLICSGGSGDMTLVAGTYDIWFDLTNTKVYIMTPGKPISEAVGGEVVTPEPEPEPDPTELTWYLVGNFNGWTVADAAYTMTKEAEWFVFKGFVADGDGFKFNAGSWDINRGATGDVEPFELAANTEYEIVANGKNFSIAAGTYDVYMSLDAAKVYVMAEGLTPGQTPGEEPKPEEPEFEPEVSIYGVIGVNNDWSNDIMMYTTPVEKLYVARDVTFSDASNRKFKVRKAGTWDNSANYGTKNAGSVAVDHYSEIYSDGGSCDITVELGTYDIYLDLANMRVYVMTPGADIAIAKNGTPQPPLNQTWYLRGEFNSWGVTENAKMASENGFYVLKNFTLSTASKMKFDTGSWSTNRGGTFSNSTSGFSVVQNGADISVPAGTYDVYLNSDASKAYFLTPGTTPAN